MSTPTVTITLTGPAVSADEVEAMEAGLHMAYVQAVKGEVRHQWIVFPPASKTLGVEKDSTSILWLERVQSFQGNRSKWFRKTAAVTQSAALTPVLNSLAQDGFTVGAAIAVPLEVDDYREVWNGETPHKAIRAVDRALRPYKITVK